jgi:O-antigen ligase
LLVIARNIDVWIARAVLLSTVVVTPWLFGGVDARTQVWLFAGLAVVLACRLLRQLADRSAAGGVPAAIVPLLLALALGLLQVMPLESRLAGFLSPGVVRFRSALEVSEDSSDRSLAAHLGMEAESGSRPLSVYPASTRHDLAMLVLGVGVFLMGAVYFHTPCARLLLWGTMAVNGTALAYFGIAQRLTWNGMLYWKVPLAGGGSPFGPFVNRNNAGGLLGLCLAGAVGLVVWSGQRARRPHRVDGMILASLSLAACIAAGILCSLSRGSIVAMMAAAGFTMTAMAWKRRRRVPMAPLGIIVAAALALVAWIGMTGQVQTRLETLMHQETLSGGRIPLWRDNLKIVADFWPVGSGLGTYRYIYETYQEQPNNAWAYHAENQYLEALVEGGVPGLALVLAALALVGKACWPAVRAPRDADALAGGVAGMLAVTSQAIHSIGDFDLFLPANMVLFALVCGSIAGSAPVSPAPGRPRWHLALLRHRGVSLLLTAGLLAANLWGGRLIRRFVAVEAAVQQARAVEKLRAPSEADLATAIESLTPALDRYAEDAEAQQLLAEVWIHRYRLLALERLRRESAPGEGDANLWAFTAPSVLHHRAHYFTRNALTDPLERLRKEPIVRDNLLPALKHLILARRACPWMARVELATAQLGFLVDDPACDRDPLGRVRRLTPTDPDILFQCGGLELQAGRGDAALDAWRRCLTLDSTYLEAVVQGGSQILSPAEVVDRLLPDSPALLAEAAHTSLAKEHAEARQGIGRRLQSLVEQGNLPAAERHFFQGVALGLMERPDQAISEYLEAVQLDPRKTAWRYELAILLTQEGRTHEACEQFLVCIQMQPENAVYRTALQQIRGTSTTPRERQAPRDQ